MARVGTQAVMSAKERALRKATLGLNRGTLREFHRMRKLTKRERERRERRAAMIGGSNIRDFLAALVEGKFAERVA